MIGHTNTAGNAGPRASSGSSDVERGAFPPAKVVDEKGSGVVSASGSISSDDSTGILAKLVRFEGRMDKALGVESHAIERKLPHERQPVSWWQELNMALLWASGTMNLSCFATGFLGWEFGLSLKQALLISIFSSILGGAVSGFTATMGAATGLRQISVSRYSFGWWPNKLVAALNAIVQIGWSAVACISGGLALTAVADGRLSLVVGIIILAVVSTIISLVGLKAILLYERFAWIIFFTIFLIFFGEVGKYADNKTPTELTGLDLSGTVLTLIAIIYGSSASWVSMSSDYYVHYPVDVSRVKVFLMTTFGIAIPTSIGMSAGCVVASALNNKPEWAAIYDDQGIGFLIQTFLYPRGFAKFILTLLVLSGINVNVISIYSSAISCQQLARPFARLPRFIWTLMLFVVILALALGGRAQLNVYLQDFLGLLGYWSTSYFVIVFSEHMIFRKGNFANYDLEGWNDPERLPHGFAAASAFLIGVVGWVVGMDSTWFVGPIAKQIGAYGGDVANELTLVITAVVFLPLRHLELKYFGK
ncbi:permease for cytosine/purines, uracil, thiamine, allantoin-domain-containing protein [Xylariaceae sp. FL0255]|nr:permease for cytosine/purines, uracil, thiamine, allantoin-domain-containing protein [Xylariaceae sp. FL0255]